MGKMKDKFIEEQDKALRDAIDSFIDDDYHYDKWLKSQGHKQVTMEESIKNHDEWWNSLTDKQKQQLFEEQEAAEKERIEQEYDHTGNSTEDLKEFGGFHYEKDNKNDK
jgi:hypothetical protein